MMDFISDTLTNPTNFWGMLEAIGTIGATCVALYFGLYSLNKEKRNRPQIQLTHNEKVRFVNEQYTGLQLLIENIGKKTAKNIKIRCNEIIQNEKEYTRIVDNNILISYESIQNGERYTIPFININKNLQTIEITRLNRKKIPKRNTTFSIHITGDNILPIDKKFSYIHSDDHQEVRLQ